MLGKKQTLISGIDMGRALDPNFLHESHPILVKQEQKKKVEWGRHSLCSATSNNITIEVPNTSKEVSPPGIYTSNLSPIVKSKSSLVVLKSEAKD